MLRQMKTNLLVMGCFWHAFHGSIASAQSQQGERPNIIILFCDDLGYGDLGVYGHPTIRTPRLDRMAAEGMRFTQFYSAAAVCSPARASLLTGRYPPRHGTINIYWPGLDTGMDVQERTLADLLTAQGYASACVGKWHLGHDWQFLPRQRGFDSYYGVPYSNDMQIDPEMLFAEGAVFREGWTLKKVRELSFDGPKKPQIGLVPLMENEAVVEFPTDQGLLTKRYTERAQTFIRENQQQSFFLYLAYTMPHVPLYASDDFNGRSLRGTYGDVVEEIDWSVGEILDELKKLDLDDNTFVFFTSDNGPWLSTKLNGGSQGLLRGGKFTTWEGGMRVPGIAWWPGKIAPSSTAELASTLDLFTTSLNLAGAQLPPDCEIDGADLSDVFFAQGKSPREDFAYYRKDELVSLSFKEMENSHSRSNPKKVASPVLRWKYRTCST